jgi:hypothetical protein
LEDTKTLKMECFRCNHLNTYGVDKQCTNCNARFTKCKFFNSTRGCKFGVKCSHFHNINHSINTQFNDRFIQERKEAEYQKYKKERLEQEELEQEKLEQEQLEQEQLERHRLKQERLEQERLEREQRLEQERLDQIRLKQKRLIRLKQKQLEQIRLEQVHVCNDMYGYVNSSESEDE